MGNPFDDFTNKRPPRPSDEYGSQYEWFTAGYDDRVCAVCAALDGVTARFDSAAVELAGDAHRNCRCIWLRVGTDEHTRATIGRTLSRTALDRRR